MMKSTFKMVGLLIVAVFIGAIPAHSAGGEQDLEDCAGSKNMKIVIRSCTNVMRSNIPKQYRSAIYAYRGVAYFVENRLNESISDFTRSIYFAKRQKRNNFGSLSDLYRSRALVYKKKKQYLQAIADFTRAIKSHSKKGVFGLYDYYINRAKVYSSLGRLAKSVDDYSKAIAIDPNKKCGGAYDGRSVVYRRMGKKEQASRDYTRGILNCADMSKVLEGLKKLEKQNKQKKYELQ